MPRPAPTLNRHILNRLGQSLRSHFEDTIFAPLPPRLAELMQQLRQMVG